MSIAQFPQTYKQLSFVRAITPSVIEIGPFQEAIPGRSDPTLDELYFELTIRCNHVTRLCVVNVYYGCQTTSAVVPFLASSPVSPDRGLCPADYNHLVELLVKYYRYLVGAL